MLFILHIQGKVNMKNRNFIGSILAVLFFSGAAVLAQGGDRDLKALVSQLSSGDDSERANAARDLGYMREPGAAGPLIKALEDKEPKVRTAAAYAFGVLKDAAGVEPLIRVLENDQNFVVRRNAAESLGKIGDAKAVEPLIKAFAIKQELVDSYAKMALIQIGPPAVEPALKLMDSQDAGLRAAGAEILGKLKEKRALGPLCKALGDKDTNVAVYAVMGLTGMEEEAVAPVIGVLEKSADYWSRQRAAKVLGSIRDARAVEPLIRALGDKEGLVRESAAEALGQIKDPRAIDPLLKGLPGEKYYPTGMKFAFALGRMGDARAVEPLIKLLAGQDEEVKQSAAYALHYLQAASSISALARALAGDPSEKVRISCADALGAIKDQNVILPIMNAVKDASKSVRLTAIQNLGYISEPGSSPALIFALGDSEPEVRKKAEEVLVEMGKAVLPQLRNALSMGRRLGPDMESRVRAVIDKIGGDTEAVGASDEKAAGDKSASTPLERRRQEKQREGETPSRGRGR